jgi:ribose-phosphate pyrophosphokinase
MLKTKFFSGTANLTLAQAVAQNLKITPTPLLSKRFSDGNLYVQFSDSVKDQSCVVLQSLGLQNVNDDFMELLFILDALKRAQSRERLVVLPYFSYAKADRLEHPGTSLRAQVCAQCLQQAGATKLLALDLHSPKIAEYFQIPVINLSPVPFFIQHLKSLALTNPIFVSPDQGYQATAQNYGLALGCPAVAGKKTRRDDQEHVADIKLKGDFADKTAIIVDDFTTSGNTLIFLVNRLRELGAKQIIVCVTHYLPNLEASTRLLNCGLDQLITTNSLINSDLTPSHPKVTQLDIAPLLATAIAA